MYRVVISTCCERGQGGHTEAGSVSFLLAVTTANLRKERFLLIQSVQSTTVGRVWRQEHEMTGHIASAVGKHR